MKDILEKYAEKNGLCLNEDNVMSITESGIAGERVSGDIIFDGNNILIYCFSYEYDVAIDIINTLIICNNTDIELFKNNLIKIVILNYEEMLLKDAIEFKQQIKNSLGIIPVSFDGFDLVINK